MAGQKLDNVPNPDFGFLALHSKGTGCIINNHNPILLQIVIGRGIDLLHHSTQVLVSTSFPERNLSENTVKH